MLMVMVLGDTMSDDPGDLETYEDEESARDFWDEVDDAYARHKEDLAFEHFERIAHPELYA